MSGEVQEVFFLLARLRQFFEIFRVDDDVASRAGHYALAGALERLTRGPGDVEQPLPRRCFNFLVEGSVRPEKTHKRHASSFSCSSAALASRWQASTSSCCFV